MPSLAELDERTRPQFMRGTNIMIVSVPAPRWGSEVFAVELAKVPEPGEQIRAAGCDYVVVEVVGFNLKVVPLKRAAAAPPGARWDSCWHCKEELEPDYPHCESCPSEPDFCSDPECEQPGCWRTAKRDRPAPPPERRCFICDEVKAPLYREWNSATWRCVEHFSTEPEPGVSTDEDPL